MLLKLLPIALFAALLQGCETPDSAKLAVEAKQVLEDLKTTLDASRRGVQETTAAEIEKLHSLEYKVLEIDGKLGAPELETAFADLGKERWDCFHIEERGESLRVFCKRNPKTYLKYIPRMF